MTNAHPEADIQRAIVQALRVVLPPGAIVHHSANEIGMGGPRAKRMQQLRSGMWVYPGFPDLMVLGEGGRVLFLEVKSARGALSPAQRAFKAKAEALGFAYVLVRSVDDALSALAYHRFPVRLAGRSA